MNNFISRILSISAIHLSFKKRNILVLLLYTYDTIDFTPALGERLRASPHTVLPQNSLCGVPPTERRGVSLKPPHPLAVLTSGRDCDRPSLQLEL